MIIANSRISAKVVAEGGLDENGFPIPPRFDFGDSMECQYQINKMNYRGISNGEQFTQISFEILIQAETFEAKEIRLFHLNGMLIGDYPVLSIEALPVVGLVKILV